MNTILPKVDRCLLSIKSVIETMIGVCAWMTERPVECSNPWKTQYAQMPKQSTCAAKIGCALAPENGLQRLHQKCDKT